MNEILNVNTIRINENVCTQREVFEKIADIAVTNHLSTSNEAVIKGLAEREQEGTTGFFDGFAIPHTKSAAIEKPGVIVITTSKGVEWHSMDGKPAHCFISLLIPESEAGTTHLTLLSSISRALMHKDVRENLLNAQNPEEILKELNQALTV
jgi:PTS system fructose-specific IIA component